MGYLRVNITNIVSPNPFKVSFKSVAGDDSAYGGFTVTTGYTYYHNGTDYSSYNTCPTYPSGTTSIEISSNGLDFNSNCWVKIEDTVTKTLLSDGTEIPRYIIENIYLHDPIAYQSCCPQPESLTSICYHGCYPPFSLTAVCETDVTPYYTPTPTPTPTVVPDTPTPTPTVVPDTPTPTPTPTASGPSISVTTLICNSSSGGSHVTKRYRISIGNPPVGYSVEMGSSFGASFSIGTDGGGYYIYMDFNSSVSTSGAATINLKDNGGNIVAFDTRNYSDFYTSAIGPC